MVVNGRVGTAGLLFNDFADKWVQLIIIFDPHKMVDDVTSSHGDYCRNGRHLERDQVTTCKTSKM